jgi:hypothetical protein
MVRQDDSAWQGQLTIVLEARTERIDAASFETAVSAAASLVNAAAERGLRVRLLVTDGSDSGPTDARAALDMLLEHLAVVDRHGGGELPALRVSTRPDTGDVVLVTGSPAGDGWAELGLLHRPGSTTRVVAVGGATPPTSPSPSPSPEVEVTLIEPGRPVAAALSTMWAGSSRWSRGSPNRIGGLTLATVTLDPPLPPPPSTPLGSFDSFDSPLGSDDGRALGDLPGSGRRWVSLVTAEVSLLAVHLAVVWGFVRVYDTTFLGDLVAFTLAGYRHRHRCQAGARLRPAVASLISLTGLALVSAWLLFPDTLAFGVPSTATIRAATDAAKTAGREFGTVIAPTPALVGFQLLTGVAIWGAVHFADWAAFRLRATVEALVPAGIVFGFVSVLSGDDHRVAAAVAFALTTLTYVANHRAHLACVGDAWLGSSPMAGAASLRRTGLAMVAVAVVAGSVLAPVGAWVQPGSAGPLASDQRRWVPA